ncbi:MAG: 4-hydroxy-3-methylbut-2-enyl diphosphate reductase [Deltaproteobacteria bacterium]|jgi:4-hydroxy-3-methylbut-2-enyl diphosphate reductase|nr:4-hydroxy-3-methylbut-2-enyl diphosphate reductase [Deltaproteobacteria bacterium]
MKVLRANTAGFCMGVGLALKRLDRALQEQRKPIATLGPIIHNPQVLAEYAKKGVRRIARAEEATRGACVIIRAHGIPRTEEARLVERGAQLVDATCPRVKAAQLAIARATRQEQCLLLFGEADHPEVRGLLSYACAERYVFGSLDECKTLPLAPAGRYVLAAQTTQDIRQFVAIQAYLEQRLAGGLPSLQTICDATEKRQSEALEIAARVDCMVVVGGRDSGNTRRLAELAAGTGIPALHVENEKGLDAAFFRGKLFAGLTAGASTPKSLIDAVEFFLESL